MSGVTTSSLSLAGSLRNWVILDYEEANGLTIRPWAPFLLSFKRCSVLVLLNGRWMASSIKMMTLISLWRDLQASDSCHNLDHNVGSLIKNEMIDEPTWSRWQESWQRSFSWFHLLRARQSLLFSFMKERKRKQLCAVDLRSRLKPISTRSFSPSWRNRKELYDCLSLRVMKSKKREIIIVGLF